MGSPPEESWGPEANGEGRDPPLLEKTIEFTIR
jgi:hypothetical protein